MSINRHNYEEFFLLYVDGELSASQRTEVEKFAQQNPDLLEELELLKQAVVYPDAIKYDQKEQLFKSENGITISNCEEYFLLAVDNELNKDEQASVEKFVLKHPDLQEQFTLLQSTSLPVEEVPFAHKEELYKTEKERRVIPFSWTRIGAAAAVIILVAGMWWMQKESTIEQPAIVAKRNNNTVQPDVPRIDNKIVSDRMEQQAIASAENKTTKEVNKMPEAISKAPVQSGPVVSNNVVANVNKQLPLQQKEQQKPKLLPPTQDMLAALINPSNSAGKPVNAASNVTLKNDLVDANARTAASDNSPHVVSNAVYKEMAEDEDDHIILIGSAEINKNKLKSLLGRASSLFKRKGDKHDDDDNSISIANFEIKK